jgi:hypothetical protein
MGLWNHPLTQTPSADWVHPQSGLQLVHQSAIGAIQDFFSIHPDNTRLSPDLKVEDFTFYRLQVVHSTNLVVVKVVPGRASTSHSRHG